jgi:hypothetical protein
VPQIAVRIVSADLPHQSEDEVWQADPVQPGRVSNFNFAWIWRGGSNA